MSGFSGADIAQVRALGGRMRTQSAKLREIANSSTFALMAAEWTGNDIDAIRDNWRRGSLPTVTRLADLLHEMSVDLERQAGEQERVSGGSTTSPGGSWLDNFRDWINRMIPRFYAPLPGEDPAPAENPGAVINPNPSSDGRADDKSQEPPIPEAGPRASNDAAFQAWRAQHPEGSRLDFNGDGYLQCVELVNGYAESIFPGHSKSEVVGNAASAKDMYAAASDQYFEKVPGPPQPGDIIVIGANEYSPTHGHVAIVESTDPLRVVQQSGAESHQTRGTFSSGVSTVEMNALVGYLRPKH